MASNDSSNNIESLNGLMSSLAGLLSQQVTNNVREMVEFTCKEALEMSRNNVQMLETNMMLIEENEAKLREKIIQLEQKVAQFEHQVQQVNSTAIDGANRSELEQQELFYSWDKDACSRFLHISNSGLTVEVGRKFFLPLMTNKLGGTLRAKHPLQMGSQLAYFEVKLLKMIKFIIVGLVTRDHPTNNVIALLPGVDDENKKNGWALAFNRTFETRTVGCGIMPNGQLFFTVNGILLPYYKRAESHVHFPNVNDNIEQLYPAVTLVGIGTKVEENFGGDPSEPFLFRLDKWKL